MGSRGVVIGTSVTSQSDRIEVNGVLDQGHLKRLLLYWDYLCHASVNGLGPNVSGMSDVAFLEQEGIFSVEPVTLQIDKIVPPARMSGPGVVGIPFDYLAEVQLHAQLELANIKAQQGTTLWSVAQMGDSLQLPKQPAGQQETLIEFSLVNCLPVPSAATPIQDILEFRSKYSQELLGFRLALEEIRNTVRADDDPRRALLVAKERIEYSVQQISHSLDRSNLPFHFETVKSFLDATPGWPMLLALGSLGISGIESPLTWGALAGAAISPAIGLAVRYQNGVKKIPDSLTDFAYVYRAQKAF